MTNHRAWPSNASRATWRACEARGYCKATGTTPSRTTRSTWRRGFGFRAGSCAGPCGEICRKCCVRSELVLNSSRSRKRSSSHVAPIGPHCVGCGGPGAGCLQTRTGTAAATGQASVPSESLREGLRLFPGRAHRQNAVYFRLGGRRSERAFGGIGRYGRANARRLLQYTPHARRARSRLRRGSEGNDLYDRHGHLAESLRLAVRVLRTRPAADGLLGTNAAFGGSGIPRRDRGRRRAAVDRRSTTEVLR